MLKMANIENVINQMDKELNYWVNKHKENKEQHEIQISKVCELFYSTRCLFWYPSLNNKSTLNPK